MSTNINIKKTKMKTKSIFQVLLIALSFTLVVPVVLLMPGMVALSQNFALVGLLQDMDLAPQPPEMSGT